jgi:hypothetical protein
MTRIRAADPIAAGFKAGSTSLFIIPHLTSSALAVTLAARLRTATAVLKNALHGKRWLRWRAAYKGISRID